MKILTTVGTTKFDSLIKYVDSESYFNDLYIEFQIADGKYIPKNHPYFSFISGIEKKYQESDIVITHAGAGTIYKLLEMQKKMIVVPNLDRIDKHQMDIAEFVSKNKFALVAYNLTQLGIFLDFIQNYNFNIFKKEKFFKTDEIVEYLLYKSA